MNFIDRIEAFTKLGNILRDWENSEYAAFIFASIQKQSTENHWFIEEHIRFSIQAEGEMLQEEQLSRISKKYGVFFENNSDINQTIAVISAGNIPMVGFHDFFSVLICGCRYMGKLSKHDNILLPVIANILIQQQPCFKEYILFCDKLENFDKIIMTGSNNSARYFEYYFGKYPHILRKNRNSIAILTGDESETDLENLFEDMFLYFGLGCRSVSMLFVPPHYSFDKMLEVFTRKGKNIAQHHHYLNNLDYQKTMHLMNRVHYIDAGIAILVEKRELNSPISVFNFSYYQNIHEISDFISAEKENIQCIVSKSDVEFGKSQRPQIDDFADNINTIQWIINR